jgi:hypothetical protein
LPCLVDHSNSSLVNPNVDKWLEYPAITRGRGYQAGIQAGEARILDILHQGLNLCCAQTKTKVKKLDLKAEILDF